MLVCIVNGKTRRLSRNAQPLHPTASPTPAPYIVNIAQQPYIIAVPSQATGHVPIIASTYIPPSSAHISVTSTPSAPHDSSTTHPMLTRSHGDSYTPQEQHMDTITSTLLTSKTATEKRTNASWDDDNVVRKFEKIRTVMRDDFKPKSNTNVSAAKYCDANG